MTEVETPRPHLHACVWFSVVPHLHACVWFSVVPGSVTSQTVAHQAPLSMGSSRRERWSGLPFLPPGDLPDLGSNPCLRHWQADSLPLSYLGSPPALQTHKWWTLVALLFFFENKSISPSHCRSLMSHCFSGLICT